MKRLLICLLLFSMSSCVGTCNRMVDDASNTVVQQFSPSALLAKYEWFKDASAALDAKLATLGTYETRFSDIKESYGKDSLTRSKWSRDDREQWNIWESEYTGIKASYNELSATYNSDMAKFNYAFCNRGSLPQGAENPLPREYKPYLNH